MTAGRRHRRETGPRAKGKGKARARVFSGWLLAGGALSIAAILALLVSRGGWSPREAVRPAPAEAPTLDLTDMEGPVARALARARAAVLADPRSGEAWGRLGIACDAHELFEEAEVCYRAARSLAPAEFRWAYFLGRVLEIRGASAAEVVAEFETAGRIHPDYVPLLIRWGEALMRGDRLDESKAVLQRAVRGEPGSARAHRGLGQVLLASGDAPGAVEELERSAQLAPEDGACWASLAAAHARGGEIAAGREAQEKARSRRGIHTFPDSLLMEVSRAAVTAEACVARAAEAMRRGDHRAAIPELEMALESQSSDADLRLRIANAYSNSGRLSDAAAHLGKALELRPEFPEAHAELANVLMGQGEFKEALEHYRLAEPAFHEDSAFLVRYANALAQNGLLEEAVSSFEKAQRLGQLDATSLLNWGSALAQQGAFQEATVRFEGALKLDPKSANAHFNLGIALEDLGRPEEAIRHYQRALELEPAHRAGLRLQALSRAR